MRPTNTDSYEGRCNALGMLMGSAAASGFGFVLLPATRRPLYVVIDGLSTGAGKVLRAGIDSVVTAVPDVDEGGRMAAEGRLDRWLQTRCSPGTVGRAGASFWQMRRAGGMP